MNIQHSQIKPNVLPIHRDKYDAALRETKQLTFRGYIPETVQIIQDKQLPYVKTQIQSVIRGNVRNWLILNAIRIVVGLKPISVQKQCTDADVIDAVTLN
jgi:hypothetical protein